MSSAKKAWDCIVFSPLAQGLLSDRYLQGIPSDSRAAHDFFLKRKDIDERKVAMLRGVEHDSATARTIPCRDGCRMGVARSARDQRAGRTSKVQQVDDNVAAFEEPVVLVRRTPQDRCLLAGKQSAA